MLAIYAAQLMGPGSIAKRAATIQRLFCRWTVGMSGDDARLFTGSKKLPQILWAYPQ